MSDRPAKLPFNATWVMEASRRCASGEKAVWLKILALQSAEGCWLTAASLGARLGFTAETAETYRRRLSKLGLLVERPRPGAKNTRGWFAQLPTECIPRGLFKRPDGRFDDDELLRLAGLLDEYLERQGVAEPESGPNPSPARTRVRPEPESGPNPSPDALPPTSSPISLSVRKHQLQPQMERKNGAGAFAPKAEDGEDRAETHQAVELRDRIRRKQAGL